MTIRKFYKYLINNYTLFLRFQIWRVKKRYPAKVLNENFAEGRPTVHFIHRYITDNTGDMACGYYRYFLNEFKDYHCIVHDINAVNVALIRNLDMVVIGGGGLLNATEEWNFNINEAVSAAGRSVIWSAGFNSNGQKIKNGIKWNKLNLVAVRDFNYGEFRYLPCATCMLSELDVNYTRKREIGVVAHKDFPKHISDEINQYEKITNKDSLEQMIGFIGSSEIILTNSYHAVYWSVLMKKKCILFAPRSEKYNFYKYPPTLFSGNLELDISNTVIYPNALEESRKLTMKYLDDIKSLLINN